MEIRGSLFRHHVPFYTFILHNLNYFFLVCNSSVNFLVYCFVGRDFKARLAKLARDSCQRCAKIAAWPLEKCCRKH